MDSTNTLTPQEMQEYQNLFNEEVERKIAVLKKMPRDMALTLGALMMTALQIRDPQAYEDVLAGIKEGVERSAT